ncbi:MAG: AMP-binding protein [Cyanothece sp. SIO1E1]|nr:AMP-binding protein [Cyanothece sp. SIO1E1]
MSHRLPNPLLEPFTLVDLLRWRALHQPHQLAYIFLKDGEMDEVPLTYGELDQKARAIGALLHHLQMGGKRVVLLYPAGLEYIAAFFGCLYAGAIAVPAYPPRPNRSIARLQAVLKDAQAKIALTTTTIQSNLEKRFADYPELQALHWVTTNDLNQDELALGWQAPLVNPHTLALLQYTSGSTAAPKGVMLTHDNLLYNSALINQGFEDTAQSQGVSWLPPYHDMGLIGGVLQPLYVGAPTTLMAPVAFLQKPFRWLQAISRYRATTSGGPNFAYELCLRKTTPEQRATLDLSPWRLAFSGAEPIHHETLKEFVTAFGPQGFQWESFYPCYGLAEATLFVTGGQKAAQPFIYTINSAALEQNRAVAIAEGTEASRPLVGCGQPWHHQAVLIVDPITHLECPVDGIGEIWVANSRGIAQGYWQRAEATQETFHAYLADTDKGPFMRTGDLGFMQAGQLFVTGRLKDLIVIRGRNHYPKDIELTVEQSHPALRPSCGAAFSIEIDGQEQLVVVQEVERSHLRNLDVDGVTTAIRRAISEQHELQLYALVLLKTGSIPKTSSGKIQRHACYAGFLDQSLVSVHLWQLAAAYPATPVAQNGHQPQPMDAVGAHKLSNSASNQAALNPQNTSANQPASQAKTDHLIQWLRAYANERINSQIIDERRCIPPYIVLDMGNQGLLGMQVPEHYGGIALTHTDTMRIMEQLGAIDPTLSLFVGLNNILGIRPILNYASKEVRDHWLPTLATGRELAAFALTEPGAGSNPQAIAAQAIPYSHGGWQLKGTKIWSGSAAWAGVINVFVQHLDAHGKASGVSGFVVQQGSKGLRQGPESLTMGMRGMIQNTVYLDDVAVDEKSLLGAPGAGMAAAQDAMMYGRLTIGASSVGGMKRCAQLMWRYASTRSVATGRLLDNPVTLARLSELTAAIAAVEALITRITGLLDAGDIVPVDAYVVCKTAGPEFLWQAADSLVQMLGGRGYIETNIAPQILRDARILRIFEGPTETLNMFLGSRVINQSEELHQFLGHQLACEAVSGRLKLAAEKINHRCLGPLAPFSDRSAALRWAYTLTGEVAMYAVLLAALQSCLQQTASERLRRAAEWADLRFEQALARALHGTAAESVLLTATKATDWISSYTTSIGDLEQTLAGEDRELDSLIRKNPQLHHPDAPIGHQPWIISNGTPKSKTTPQTLNPNSSQSVATASTHTAADIQAWMVDWLVKALSIPATAIDTSKSFADYGLDSVTAVELADALEDWLGMTLSPTLAYEYPTIQALASYLSAELGGTGGESETVIEGSNSDAEVDQLLTALEQLSDAEARELLGMQAH